jgi:hypothetical protein
LGAEIGTDPDLDIDREDLIGLEVSGINHDTDPIIRARVNRKMEQVRAGRLPVRAMVGVVAFRTASIIFRTVER